MNKKNVTVKPVSIKANISANKTYVATGKKVITSKKPDSNTIKSLQSLGEQIKFKRTSLGLSIAKTSSLCGISDKTLRLIEDGNETKMSSVLNIISMLGMKLTIEDK